ncbi:hypothetical protein, partial [Bacillus cereus group sp. BfR-BA-01309]|uniref:hypothetical protein n=1 Tax=Bacillus cereus group sp. BfR-BA-01309 TaxID=2920286 RepID=UPI001F58FABD
RFDEGKLKQKRDGKATPKENIICFSFLLYYWIISHKNRSYAYEKSNSVKNPAYRLKLRWFS